MGKRKKLKLNKKNFTSEQIVELGQINYLGPDFELQYEVKERTDLVAWFMNASMKVKITAIGLATLVAIGGAGLIARDLLPEEEQDNPSYEDFDDKTIIPGYNRVEEVIFKDDNLNNDQNQENPGVSDEQNGSDNNNDLENNHDNEKEPDDSKPENNDKDNTENQKPSEEEPIPPHVHQFGEWKEVSCTEEQRNCECGEEETREANLHSYGKPLITYVNLSKLAHRKEEKMVCQKCGLSETATVIENCKIVVESYTSTKENRVCEDCGNHTTGTHNLDNGTKNSDGSITYSCTNDGCEYTKKEKPYDNSDSSDDREPNPGPDEPGPVEPGPDEPGPVEPGPDEPGPVEPGPDEPGPVEPGPDEPGPVEPGPDEPGPVEPGPDDSDDRDYENSGTNENYGESGNEFEDWDFEEPQLSSESLTESSTETDAVSDIEAEISALSDLREAIIEVASLQTTTEAVASGPVFILK